MRREGRQHGTGIVRSYRILPPPLNPRLVNSFNDLFTKLPSKSPTDHYKSNRTMWSGKVHWLRSNDIASSSYKLLTWRVVTEPGPGFVPNFTDLECEEDKGEESGVETMKTEKNGHNSDKEDGGGSHDDASMSFYDVGMMMTMDHELNEDEDDDDWCLV